MSQAAEIIAQAIEAQGAISFARFMALALYCPVYGYYEKEEDTIGRAGDYYTSVSVGPLFGELLAFQFAEWLEPAPACGSQETERRAGAGACEILEAGAHNGQLARDILTWLRERRPALYERVEYRIVEPSARRRQWQAAKLRDFANKVRWMPSLAEAGASTTRSHAATALTPVHRVGGGQRIIFANELLDALPVHRLGWEATTRSWFEWGVARQGDRFVWTRLRASDASKEYRGPSPSVPAALAAVLPDGYTVEVSPAATDWWRLAAKVLGRGKLLAIDYGRSADEFLTPERQAGTLRAYRGHRSSREVLADPGEQDLTADVDFTAIQSAGEAAGLVTEAFLMQSQFLTPIAARAWQPASSFGGWTAERTRQFQTLAHPEHLGRSFRVLLQARSTPAAQSTVDCNS